MGNQLFELLEILTQPPGYLVYHLVISLSIALTGFLAALKMGSDGQEKRAQHVLIGCIALMVTQIILFSTSNLASVPLLGVKASYAIIERVISTLTILWVAWTFIETEKQLASNGTIILTTLTVIFMGVANIIWLTMQPQPENFHLTWMESAWQITALLIILISLILIFLNKTASRGVAAIILIVLALGHATQMLIYTESSLVGPVRLAQILGLPLMITLVQRFSGPTEKVEEETTDSEEESEKITDTKPKLMNLLLNISLQDTPEERFKAVVRAISLSVIADICYVVHMPNEIGEIKVDAGYDLIREEYLRPASLQRGQIPLIINAWEENNILQLPSNYSGTPDVVTLYELIQYHRIGNLLAFPLSMPDQPVVGGLIFLSPYTTKEWDREAFEILNEIKINLARIFYYADQENSFREELEQTQVAYDMLRDEKFSLEETIDGYKNTITHLETELKQVKAKSQMEKMNMARQKEAIQQKLQDLTEQNAAQKKAIQKMEQTARLLRQIEKERDQLKTELARADAKIKHLSVHAGQTGPTRLSTNNQIISLDSIIASVRMRTAKHLKRQNVNLDIVNPDGQQTIKIDPEMVQTIAGGLVENAIFASPIGGSIQLRQKLSMETGMLIIQVTDLGEGLTQADQAALFNANNEAIPGIGSVKAIRNAARAIRILNGKVWLKSKKGQYTTFRVQLPVRIID